MNKIYSKYLIKSFKQALDEKLPQFEEFKSKEANYGAKRTFLWKLEELWCFIIVRPQHSGVNEFNISISWSSKGEYPFDIMLPFFAESGEIADEFNKGEGNFDLSELFDVKSTEYWLSIDPDGLFQEHLCSGHQMGMTEKFAMNNRLIDFNPKGLSVEEVGKLIDPLIDDAIKKVKQYAIPFFEDLKKCYDADKSK